MPSPFPGMDPYLEEPERWPDFHNSFISQIRGALQPLLKPDYVAAGQERVYVAETERVVMPDVAVVRKPPTGRRGHASAAVIEPDPAKVIRMAREEVREPYLQILDPKDPSRVVTAIEVLSPKNKRPGPGRRSYVQKRKELWRRGVNLVEIDLLRAGRPTVWSGRRGAEQCGQAHYCVVVTRRTPPQHEMYPRTVRERLPRVAIPLAEGDADVTLDLQPPFDRCWDEGPFPQLLEYGGPPPGDMDEADIRWCTELLREKQQR